MLSRLFGGSAPDTSNVKNATGNEGGGSNGPKVEKDEALASHISKMDSLIRRKLHGTGAQYNMKVVIRGERGVGKSTLWRRLQGLPYEEKYNPTPEIQTTTINNWVYRGSQDVVKVEVWDVVDKGLARAGVSRVPEGEDLEDAVAGLPPDSSSGRGGRSLAVLDAGVVNVYQGASAIIFMVDPYRPETLDKVEKGLAEAPVELPTVVLLNFRDKLEEDAVKASEKPGNPSPASKQPPKQPSAPPPPPAVASAADPSPSDAGGDALAAASTAAAVTEKGDISGAGGPRGVSGGGDPPIAGDGAAATVDGDGGVAGDHRGGTGGAWDHVVTLETARLMMDRVREADDAAGRGTGRRVSLFDCSMKNCFGLRVLYTYLNVPFLELKRKALLQQAEIASERLEKEYQELAGFIGGHSYGNYMQHLRSSDVDPTAGARTVPAAPPGRPSIASMPAAGELPSSLERRGSLDSHGGGGGSKKDKKKKHHKDKDKDKSKKKDKHRHKSGKSKKDEREEAAPPEYGGRVTDAKNFTPATKKTATDELADFFGESSEEGSDEGSRERRKVVKAINPSALANAAAAAAQDEASDSDEMPAPRTSRLIRVTAPVKPATIASTPNPRSTTTDPVIPSARPTPPALATPTTVPDTPTASDPRQQRVAPVVTGVARSPPAVDSSKPRSGAARDSGSRSSVVGAEERDQSAVIEDERATLKGSTASGAAPGGLVDGVDKKREESRGVKGKEEGDDAPREVVTSSEVVQGGKKHAAETQEREREEGKFEVEREGAVAAAEEEAEEKEEEEEEEKEGGVDGEGVSQTGATGDPSTPASSTATGNGTAKGEKGDEDKDERGETKDSQEVRKGRGHGEADGHDGGRSGFVEGRKDTGRDRERDTGAVGDGEGGGGGEAEREQATPNRVSSPPTPQPSPTAREDAPPEFGASRCSPETVPSESGEDASVGAAETTTPDDKADLESDDAAGAATDGGTRIDDPHEAADKEPEPSEGMDTGVTPGSDGSASEEEGAIPSATAVVGVEAETDIAGGERGSTGNGGRREDAAKEEEKEGSGASAAETEEAVPEPHSAVTEDSDEAEGRRGGNDELKRQEDGGAGRDERGNKDGGGIEGDGNSALDGGTGTDNGGEAAVGEAAEGGVSDNEPATAARDLETSNGVTPLSVEEAPSGGGGGGVAEDFFAADDSSSEENELFSAATASAAPAGDPGDSDDGTPTHGQPPSPQIIASSLQARNGGSSRFPVGGAQRKAAAAAAEGGGAAAGGGGGSGGGLSEAARAAVEAALANATRGSSRKQDEDGGAPKSRKKKKKSSSSSSSSHKERRRKGSGSRSGGEGDPGAAVVGRSEAEGTERQKRSSSRRHRKSGV